ncbi:MAG: molybdate ABC transporter substrate-binding protein [Verrucomicrobiota bacterium]
MIEAIRKRTGKWNWLSFLAVTFLCSCRDDDTDFTLAVASNFRMAAEELANDFRNRHGIAPSIVSGSTGKLTSQIRNGAPFDIFLSADAASPSSLQKDGFGGRTESFLYATGTLVLYSSFPGLDVDEGAFLAEGEFRHLAIANPEFAPYGRAARETLESLGLWREIEEKLVRGESIAQSWHFTDTGHAELGFVAASQLVRREDLGSSWIVPADLHTPIEQHALLLRDSEPANQFILYLKSTEAAAIIRAHGYTPGNDVE